MNTTVGQQEVRKDPPSQLHQNGFVPFRAGATAPEAQAFSDKIIHEGGRNDAWATARAAIPDLRNSVLFLKNVNSAKSGLV